MEPLQYLRIIRRHWRLVGICVIAGVVLGLASTAVTGDDQGDDVYAATHSLNYTLDTSGGPQIFTFDQLAYTAIIGEVPDRVGERLGRDGTVLAAQIQANPNPQLGTIDISAAGPDPARVVELADTFAEELTSYVAEQAQQDYDNDVATSTARVESLGEQIKDLNEQLDGGPADANLLEEELKALLNQFRQATEAQQNLLAQGAPTVALSTLQSAAAIPISGSEFRDRVAEAFVPDNGNGNGKNDEQANSVRSALGSSSGSPLDSPVTRTLLGGFLGLLAGIAGALVLDRLDHRLRTKADTEATFGLPVLAEVPPLSRLQQGDTDVVSFTNPLSRTAESYRALRSSLLFYAGTRRDRGTNGSSDRPRSSLVDGKNVSAGVILVTSPNPDEGKTTTVANLAAVFAEADLKVLVLNCDFRRPRLHSYLGGEAVPRKVTNTQIPGVRIVYNVVADPDTNPAEVVAAQRRAVETARGLFDVILLDTAPLLTTNDAAEIIPSADMVLLVCQAEKTSRESADRAAEMLERLNADVAGVVLLGAREIPNARYYYYSSDNKRDIEQAQAIRADESEGDLDFALTATSRSAGNSDTDDDT